MLDAVIAYFDQNGPSSCKKRNLFLQVYDSFTVISFLYLAFLLHLNQVDDCRLCRHRLGYLHQFDQS